MSLVASLLESLTLPIQLGRSYDNASIGSLLSVIPFGVHNGDMDCLELKQFGESNGWPQEFAIWFISH
jgi:hypothetical protein